MLHYRIHGRLLASAVPLPELHEAAALEDPAWVLTVSSTVAAEPAPDSVLLGEEELPAYCARVSLWRGADGRHRLVYSDTGVFELSSNGKEILWYQPPATDVELARMDIVGRVLGLASYLLGDLVLHASGVEWAGKALAFAAPKFYGKSTLAVALADRGARLVSDDTIAIRGAPEVQCAPGVPSLRLRRESARHLGRLQPTDRAADRIVEKLALERTTSHFVPLAALYVLDPRPPGEDPASLRRTPLSRMEAALALVKYSKLGGLLGRSESANYLDRAAQIAARLPVYVLTYCRDFAKLPEVVENLLSWHSE
jgi:hypothetical protein